MRTAPILYVPALLLAAAAAVLALDWLTPLGYGVFVLYAPICLTCLWLRGWRPAFLMGGLCSLLIVVGLFISQPGMPYVWSVISRSLALIALWSVLWGGKVFAQRTVELERAKLSLQQEVEQRMKVEEALRVTNEELESRVAQRTTQLQAALDRWELVTQATHDGIYDWDLTTRRVIYSHQWNEMHGYSPQGHSEGVEHWSEWIHPDDRSRVLGHLDEYLARRRQEFREEFRIRRGDGSWMWILHRGIALWNDAGQAVRMVGSEKNITERKRAEELLRRHEAQLENMTAKLLTAQEHERQRIAREMHDDFTQRLAALAVDIGMLERSCSLDTSLRGHLHRLRQAAGQLADDVHNFAYQLHPSLLEHLGLEAAIRDQVDGFSRRTGLAVRYKQRDIPKPISMDIATCLYRVTQECLQNVLKHAEASEVLVQVLGTSTGVGVCVHDNGKGFSQNQAGIVSPGLGLISMEERVRLLQGTFRIRTSPGGGTEVHAWVPVVSLAGKDDGKTERIRSNGLRPRDDRNMTYGEG